MFPLTRQRCTSGRDILESSESVAETGEIRSDQSVHRSGANDIDWSDPLICTSRSGFGSSAFDSLPISLSRCSSEVAEAKPEFVVVELVVPVNFLSDGSKLLRMRTSTGRGCSE